jgi:hypothetical protein
LHPPFISCAFIKAGFITGSYGTPGEYDRIEDPEENKNYYSILFKVNEITR